MPTEICLDLFKDYRYIFLYIFFVNINNIGRNHLTIFIYQTFKLYFSKEILFNQRQFFNNSQNQTIMLLMSNFHMMKLTQT